MFIARVSKGRTIREFITGVLIIPSFLTFFWLSAMGGSAIFIDLHNEASNLAEQITQDEATALFVFLGEFPFATIGSIVGMILIASFFVTSSDSGSLVIDSITAGGKLDAPVAQRVFWACTERAVAAVLLIGGGLTALQTATISTGLPFLVILLVMAYSLRKGLQKEFAEMTLLSQEKSRKNYEGKLAEVVWKNIQKRNKTTEPDSTPKKTK